MRVVRSAFLGPKYDATISDIQTALQCSYRTAQRIYAGQSVNGDTTLAALTTVQAGGPLLEEALRRVPLERRADVAAALRDAADLIRMEAEHEKLARELANKRAAR
jgi:hypothetical protein